MAKIGIIGSGNMGQALINGWLKTSNQLAVYSPNHGEAIANQYHIDFLHLLELTSWSDILVLAFLPQQLSKISDQISSKINSNQTIISVLGGISLAQIMEAFPNTDNIVKTMPNTNVKVNKGEIAYIANSKMSSKKLKDICNLLKNLGDIFPLAESDFETFGALAGSGPAIVAKFAESLVLAGVKNGLDRSTMIEIVSKLIIGTIKNVQKTGISFNDLIYQISTPGGSTIRGITELENDGFSGKLISACDKIMASS